MCELMTIAAAIAFTAVYFGGIKTRAVFAAMMMFWGAAIMWSVDCFHSAMEGEAFFDMSSGDAILGAIILAAGLAVFALESFLWRGQTQSK